jgi:hypothetical protein
MRTFLKTFLVVLFVVIVSVFAAERDEKGDDLSSLMMVPYYINLPGWFIYVLSTGDIHDTRPGPIGPAGRYAVTIAGSTLVWSAVVFFAWRSKNRW